MLGYPEINYAKRDVLRDPSFGRLVTFLTNEHEDDHKEWFPTELLFPDGSYEDNNDRVEQIQLLIKEGAQIEPATLVAVALNSLTESGLATFNNLLTGYVGEIGSPLDRWVKRWTAEENRHDRAMELFRSLIGRFDAGAFERLQFQYLLQGFRPDWIDSEGKLDPFRLVSYVSIQEIATQIAHGRVANKIKDSAPIFSRTLSRISAEEFGHGRVYRGILKGIFERMPSEATISLLCMVKKFSMPGVSIPSFKKIESVTTKTDVFTPKDLGKLIKGLFDELQVEKLTNLSGEAEQARDELSVYPDRVIRIYERRKKVLKKSSPSTFFLGLLLLPSVHQHSGVNRRVLRDVPFLFSYTFYI